MSDGPAGGFFAFSLQPRMVDGQAAAGGRRRRPTYSAIANITMISAMAGASQKPSGERARGQPSMNMPGLASMARRDARVGDRERALTSLERAYEARHHPRAYVGIEPLFDSVCQEGRFRDLVGRVGLARSK